MKIKELFEEAEGKRVVKGTPEEIADILKDKCGEFIAAYKQTRGKMLYRGISGIGRAEPLCVYSPIRTDRKPVEMGEQEHTLISNAMDQLNLPTRRNGLFATTSRTTASDWGKPYIIFVEDGWKGVVFERIGVDDYAFSEFQDYARGALRDERFTARSSKPEKAIDLMVNFIEEQDPFVFDDAGGLAKVIGKKYTDIIIKGKGYYALNLLGEEETNTVLELLGFRI